MSPSPHQRHPHPSTSSPPINVIPGSTRDLCQLPEILNQVQDDRGMAFVIPGLTRDPCQHPEILNQVQGDVAYLSSRA